LQRVPYGKYTKEFREEAVKVALEKGLSCDEAAKRLSVPPSTLASWVKAARVGKLGEVGKTYRPLTEIELELAATKKQLAEAKMECEILKKAAAYFARESQPGMRR
jgi:transposase